MPEERDDIVRAQVKITRLIVQQAEIEVETTLEFAQEYAGEKATHWGHGYAWKEVPKSARVLHTQLLSVERPVKGEPEWNPESLRDMRIEFPHPEAETG